MLSSMIWLNPSFPLTGCLLLHVHPPPNEKQLAINSCTRFNVPSLKTCMCHALPPCHNVWIGPKFRSILKKQFNIIVRILSSSETWSQWRYEGLWTLLLRFDYLFWPRRKLLLQGRHARIIMRKWLNCLELVCSVKCGLDLIKSRQARFTSCWIFFVLLLW